MLAIERADFTDGAADRGLVPPLTTTEALVFLRRSLDNASFSGGTVVVVVWESTEFMEAEEDNTGGVSLESGRGSFDSPARREDAVDVILEVVERVLRAIDFIDAAELFTASLDLRTLGLAVSVRSDCMLMTSDSSPLRGRKLPLTPLGATEGVMGLSRSSSLTSISVDPDSEAASAEMSSSYLP